MEFHVRDGCRKGTVGVAGSVGERVARWDGCRKARVESQVEKELQVGVGRVYRLGRKGTGIDCSVKGLCVKEGRCVGREQWGSLRQSWVHMWESRQRV